MLVEQRINRDWTKTLSSAASTIYGSISYTDKKSFSLIDVMGIAGHAFRLNIDPIEVNVAGPTSFPGGYIFRRNLCNLGFTSNMGEASVPVSPDMLEKTIALIQRSVDKGYPAIAFDLFTPEFGLIYGYDDDKQLFYAKDVSQDGTLSYSQFGQPKIPVLFLITIEDSLAHSKYEILRMSLDMIVDHARGREWAHMFKDRYVQGLKGYEAWIEAMEKRSADEFGNAYNAAVAADAREFAAEYLREMALKWDGSNVVERNVRTHAAEAAAHYAVVAEALGELRDMFPFPEGGTPKEPATADRAIALLLQAKESETKGVEVLEKLLNFMKAYHSDIWVH
ncbi:hypothetical protein GCM10008018_67030 [Paenibacillus marchantiophytorum]|uniref:DUF4872 domain-containing protein n=1 Tax=Paenibacillus marchantiophytorum TaxID=1619310 RepID=A0ABQ1FH41_9BACL|nr:hypothetical protein [Paenibacillus marchantiophytorum]GGA12598.1 hypothetical protein GCM10008018_67030 [Paenibacillus marchantiophytorum]